MSQLGRAERERDREIEKDRGLRGTEHVHSRLVPLRVRARGGVFLTCVLCQITDALEWPSLFRQGPLS